jgi:hypothetical protein
MAVQTLQLSFRKQAVSLQKPLSHIPERLGPWVQVSVDTRLRPDIEHTLGATEYIFRDYLDSRLVSEEVLRKFVGVSDEERGRMIGALLQKHPEAYIHVTVQFYTGMVDTVAHIPDRCFIAGGYEQTEYKVAQWACFAGKPGENPAARYIQFEDRIRPGQLPRQVAYFFHVNGRFENDPLEVRQVLQDLFERYGYYSKVELMTLTPDRTKAAGVLNDFLTHALPEIEKALPNWEKIKAEEAARHNQ